MPEELVANELEELSADVQEELQAALVTSQRLFIVSGVEDLTEYITVPSYKVNLLEGYDEWTDNNKTTHRDINSLKVQGSFSVKFETLEEYQTFMLVMKNYKKSNGSYDCTVYCNNTLETVTVEMFIDFEPANIMPYIGSKDYDPIEITVTQRGNQYIWPPDQS